MRKNKITEPEQIETLAPRSLVDLSTQMVIDIAAGESASFVADEFFEDFVNQNRPEVQQVLMLLDMPNETVVQGLIDIQMQAIEVIRQNAPDYLNELRNEVKSRLAKMAVN
jgi:hypothetical protein